MAVFVGDQNDNSISGKDTDDLLQGLGGDDTLNGKLGLDTLQGGQGDDRYIVKQPDKVPLDLVQENANEGIDTVLWIAGPGYKSFGEINPNAVYELPENVENLEIESYSGGPWVGWTGIEGNALGNLMTAGANLQATVEFHGGEGADTLRGGANFDWLQGDSGNDLLIGNAYVGAFFDDDTLVGGDGADTMVGRSGNDQYWVESLDDVVDESTGSGTDIVLWTGAGNYVIDDGIERVFLREGSTQATGSVRDDYLRSEYGQRAPLPEGGTGSVSLNGLAGDDTLTGGDADESGQGGDDTLLGGAGQDVVQAGSGEDMVRGGGDFDFIRGGGGADTLLGDAGDDWLDGDDGGDPFRTNAPGTGGDALAGGAGKDVLVGGGGADTLTGGKGADVFYGGDRFGSTSQDVVRDYRDGEDRILARGGFADVVGIRQEFADTIIDFADGGSLRLEQVRAFRIDESDFANAIIGEGHTSQPGTAQDDYIDVGRDDALDFGADTVEAKAGNDYVFGGGGDDKLYGGDGNDTLVGGSGADQLEGGAGDDVYIVNGPGDAIVEKVGGGADTIVSTGDITLAANVENLIVGDGGVAVDKGGVPGFTVSGNAGDNRIQGSSGRDSISGLEGRDTLLGAGGADKLFGDGDRDWLDGGDKRDALDGGAGADTLVGGIGADVLTGGDGADLFLFTRFKDGGDRIVDFGRGADTIDISAIDAHEGQAGDQAAHFVDALSGAAGEAVLTYDAAADSTRFAVDVDGDAVGDFKLDLDGHVTADSGWML